MEKFHIIDFEGTEMGFDIELINKIYDLMEKPLIISGGCGYLNDISKVKEKFSKVSIALASVLHYDTLSISDIRKFRMKNKQLLIMVWVMFKVYIMQ